MADTNDAAKQAVMNAAEGYDGVAVQDELGEVKIVHNDHNADPDDPGDGEEVQEEDTISKTNNTEDEVEQPESNEVSGSDPDIQSALDLYKALNSPHAGEVLKALAKAKGIELAEDYEIVESNEGEVLDFTKFVKDRLNPKFEFLAEDLGKIFKDFGALQDKKVSTIKQDTARDGYVSKLQTVMEKFGTDNGINIEDSKNPVSNKMVEIGKTMKFTGRTPQEYRSYLDRVHNIAKSELGIKDSNKDDVVDKVNKINKINKNLSASGPEAVKTAETKTAEHVAPKDLSAEDAVRAAMRGIKFKR